MATNKRTVTIGGKSVDITKLEDIAQLQASLLPENWPGTKRDGVRLYIAFQELLKAEYLKHLAHNFKRIAKVAIDQKEEDSEAPVVVVNFAAELNFSALTVAAIGKPKMSFSRKFTSEGKAKTVDINQDELPLGDDNLDPNALDAEQAEDERIEAEKEAAEQKEKEAAAAAKEKAKAKKPRKTEKAGE